MFTCLEVSSKDQRCSQQGDRTDYSQEVIGDLISREPEQRRCGRDTAKGCYVIPGVLPGTTPRLLIW